MSCCFGWSVLLFFHWQPGFVMWVQFSYVLSLPEDFSCSKFFLFVFLCLMLAYFRSCFSIILLCWILTTLCWVLTGFDFFFHTWVKNSSLCLCMRVSKKSVFFFFPFTILGKQPILKKQQNDVVWNRTQTSTVLTRSFSFDMQFCERHLFSPCELRTKPSEQ